MQDSWLFVLGILGFIGFVVHRSTLIVYQDRNYHNYYNYCTACLVGADRRICPNHFLTQRQISFIVPRSTLIANRSPFILQKTNINMSPHHKQKIFNNYNNFCPFSAPSTKFLKNLHI